MSLIQRLFTSLVPDSWAESMEAESRRWLVHCRCGCARSVWELGGIRWKAAGQPRRLMRCPQCGQISWHKLQYERSESS